MVWQRYFPRLLLVVEEVVAAALDLLQAEVGHGIPASARWSGQACK